MSADAAGAADAAGTRAGPVPGAANAPSSAVERYRALERDQDGRSVPLSSPVQQQRVNADSSDLLAHIQDLNVSGEELLREVRAWYVDTDDDPVWMLAHSSKRIRGRLRTAIRQRRAQIDMNAHIPGAVGNQLDALANNPVDSAMVKDDRGGANSEAPQETVSDAVIRDDRDGANHDGSKKTVPAAAARETEAAAFRGTEADAEAHDQGTGRIDQDRFVATSSTNPNQNLVAVHSSARHDYGRQSFSELYTSESSRYGGKSEESF